ncbi:MAG: hypothetical protein JNL12_04760 [Planctomycetes bacterium]|nr:hypothetical protein [Planctomycetota bacterium]
MTTFDRRSFFARSLASVAGLAAAPTWLAHAFGLGAPAAGAQDPAPGTVADPVAAWRKQQLTAAIATAKAHGKPLLVLVVPDAQDKVWEGSQWFGAWLTHGDALARETFGLCTLVCARMGEVEEMAGVRGDAVAKTTKAVTMLLVDPTRAGQEVDKPIRATRIELEVPAITPGARRAEGDVSPEDAVALRRKGLAAMTAALQVGLEKHGATLDELAKASLRTLDDAQQKALTAWLEAGTPVPAELLVRGLPELRRRLAAASEADRAARLPQLAAAIETVVVRRQVAGSRWQRSGGCGNDFEAPTEEEKKNGLMIACGLGTVPPLCERFLGFYSVGS